MNFEAVERSWHFGASLGFLGVLVFRRLSMAMSLGSVKW